MASAVGRLGWKNGFGVGPEFEIRTVYDLLDVIRQMPGLFLAEPSVSALYFTLNGFRLALDTFRLPVEREMPPFQGFHDYVAKVFGHSSSVPGWRNLLLEAHDGDDLAAFNAFFPLLEKFRAQHHTDVR